MSDAAESLLGESDEEKSWSDITARDLGMARRKESRKRRVWVAAMSIRSLVDTVLLLLILGLLLDRQGWRSSLFEVGGDITGFAPRCKSWCKTVCWLEFHR